MTTLRQQMAAKRLKRRLRMVVAPAVLGAGLGVSLLFMVNWMAARAAPSLISDFPNSASSSAFYPDCTAARAAGAAPITIGRPGYRPELDADHDGVACEPHPR